MSGPHGYWEVDNREGGAYGCSYDSRLVKQGRREMYYEAIPYIWYLAGSICFAVGTLVMLARMLRDV